MSSTEVLDAAYERLAPFDFEFAGGFADHGPMVAEALVRLGRADAIAPWVERHVALLDPMRPPVAPIDDWIVALGDRDRSADWLGLFTSELGREPWADVVALWAPRLIPGAFAAATHGLIRTAHAVRAIDEVVTAPRQGELARGLALWASTYRELPGPPRPNGTHDLATILDELAATARPARGMITTAVAARVDADPGFVTAVDSVAPPADANRALLDLTAEAARRYLRGAEQFPIALVHGVTGPAAARLLLAHLAPVHHGALFAYSWQVVAAMVATYGGDQHGRLDRGATPGTAEIVDRAVAGGDEHAIKMAEACLRENRENPDGVYVLAAADAVARL
ncbi:MAG: questin oxidase family protein [Acidimicrobiia bacterium]